MAFGVIFFIVPFGPHLVNNERCVDKYLGLDFDPARAAAGDGGR
jgi:hypothetical protein